MAWASDDVQEIVTESVCIAALAAYARRLGGGRWYLVLVLPIPALVLFHERFHVRHWVAYGPAALSLAMAIWADRAWRTDRRG